jgi:hypothetical protein
MAKRENDHTKEIVPQLSRKVVQGTRRHGPVKSEGLANDALMETEIAKRVQEVVKKTEAAGRSK